MLASDGTSVLNINAFPFSFASFAVKIGLKIKKEMQVLLSFSSVWINAV